VTDPDWVTFEQVRARSPWPRLRAEDYYDPDLLSVDGYPRAKGRTVDILQVLALVAFLCAAVLAAVAHRVPNTWWAALVALGLALWLLSTTTLVK
jgi:hypothetical protein